MSKEIEIRFTGKGLWTAEEFRVGMEAIRTDGYPKYRGCDQNKQRRRSVEAFARWMDQGTIIGVNTRNHEIKVEVEGLRLGKIIGKLFEKYPQIKNSSKTSLVFSREEIVKKT